MDIGLVLRYFWLGIAASALTLTGCVSISKYPAVWEPVNLKIECPNISGQYGHWGKNSSNDNNVSGSRLFIGTKGKRLFLSEQIEFKQSKDELLIRALKGVEILGERRVKLREESCKDGVIKIKPPEPEGGINRDGVLGIT